MGGLFLSSGDLGPIKPIKETETGKDTAKIKQKDKDTKRIATNKIQAALALLKDQFYGGPTAT